MNTLHHRTQFWRVSRLFLRHRERSEAMQGLRTRLLDCFGLRPRNDVRALAASLLLLFSLAPAFAVDPTEQLADPKLEARAREVSGGLRCLVCQNQSIDDSDAPLARDLRLLVRRQIEKGQTNQETVDYVVARYGDFVLLKPRFTANTMLLWLAPLLLVAGGIYLAARIVRRQPEKTETVPLSPEEERELAKILTPPAAKS
jgi:cytochrome c-type biogenesis protein CcmH